MHSASVLKTVVCIAFYCRAATKLSVAISLWREEEILPASREGMEYDATVPLFLLISQIFTLTLRLPATTLQSHKIVT